MGLWSWKSSDGRTQTENAQHQEKQAARARDADKAARDRAQENQSKGRSVPQK